MRLINEAMSRVMTWLRQDKGQTLVEYALIIALISIAAVVIMGTLGGQIASVFNDIVGRLS